MMENKKHFYSAGRILAVASWSANIVGFILLILDGGATTGKESLNWNPAARNRATVPERVHGETATLRRSKPDNEKGVELPLAVAERAFGDSIPLNTPGSLLNPVIARGLKLSPKQQDEIQKRLTEAYSTLGRLFAENAVQESRGRFVIGTPASAIAAVSAKLREDLITLAGEEKGFVLSRAFSRSSWFQLGKGSEIQIVLRPGYGAFYDVTMTGADGNVIAQFGTSDTVQPAALVLGSMYKTVAAETK